MPLSKCVSASYTGRTLYGHAYLQHCCGAHHILINLFHWIVPLWVNTWIPSHTLARPSLILQKNRQNNTERKSSKAINFPFENDDFFTFKDDTNEFRDPENIEKHKLHGKIRVFLRSFTSPQHTVKCDKRESLGTPDAHMGSCAAKPLYSLTSPIMGQYISAFQYLG